MPDNQFDSFFQESAREVQLDWLWLKAQAKVESNLNPNAVSVAGAKGISQFTDATWNTTGIGSGDKFNPRDAIMAQGRYMKRLLVRFGPTDWEKAATAYNWGPDRLSNFIAKPITNAKGEIIKPAGKFIRELIVNSGPNPNETKEYYPRILKFFLLYRSSSSSVTPSEAYLAAKALQTAVKEWQSLETSRIQGEIDFLKSIDTSMSTLVDGVKEVNVSIIVSKIQGWL